MIVASPVGAPALNFSRFGPKVSVGPVDIGIDDSFNPTVSVDTPLGPVSACPPGWGCTGPSIQLPGGVSGCLGACKRGDFQTPTDTPIDRGDLDPCPAGFELREIGGELICQQTGTMPTTTKNGGCGCGPGRNIPCTTCALPDGRQGRTNKSRYYRFGDCRRGTSPGVVEPNTVCVRSRRTNFGNIKAANRAASRIKGALRHMHNLEKTVKSTLSKRR